MAEILLDAQGWPTFQVPFGRGAMVYIVFRNLEGDYGVDYLRDGVPCGGVGDQGGERGSVRPVRAPAAPVRAP
ncbi:hypothetical protein AB0M28_10590, partial [Streptomyces sp. NPDC051940]